MDVQAAPPPYIPVGGPDMSQGVPPVLGGQTLGSTGGLPAPGGMTVSDNPMAQQLQSMGRGEDSMLVHMTPGEVNSLQGLAMAAGGSLTVNPQTGLPEASFLKNILPILAGVGLNFILPGSGGIVAALGGKAATAGLMTGAAATAITGDLQSGLMAGLGAFGGASLAGGIQGAVAGAKGAGASGAASSAVPPIPDPTAAAQAATSGAKTAATGATPVASVPSGPAFTVPAAGGPMPLEALQATLPGAATSQTPAGALARFGQGFKGTAQGSMTGLAGQAAVPAAGLGLLSGVSGAMQPSGFRTAEGGMDNSYQGPYRAQQRTASFAPSTEDLLGSSRERRYFDIDQPEIYNMQGQVVQPGSHTAPGTPIVRAVPRQLTKKQRKRGEQMYDFTTFPWMGEQQEPGFARGGEVQLADGAFVVDARTVSEVGNGSSNAGIEALSRMGGRPVQGPGDGVSDSVPARIGREQPARVARDEVIFPPQAVRRMGGGSEQRGAQKLYALMDKAHKARRKSERGKDTKLRRGLA
jgi:hypothetical protein